MNLEQGKQCYFAGMADFYEVLMRLPEENLSADAKQTMTFTLAQFKRLYERKAAQSVQEVSSNDAA